MEFSITNSKTDLEVIKATADALKPYLAELRAAYEHDGYEKAECSIRLPADGTYRAAIREAVAAKKASELAYVIVAGIGGSSLGPKAVYDAVFGYDDALAPARRPKLVFLENIDPEAIGVLAARLKDEGIETRQVVVLLVSKSGNTTESLANFEILIKSLPYAAEELSSRMLFITDRDSSLWQAGEEKGIAVVEIPKNVGGRFSVFSAVGLVPLELAGISTEPLIKSAQSMIERCLSEDSTVNPALQAAAVFYRHYQAGKNINEAFIFDPRLESLGKWYRQLVGESVGKEKEDVGGGKRSVGLTPVVSIGTTDLHSIAQLDLAGPEDKIATLIWAEPETNKTVPTDRFLPSIVPMVTGKTTSDIRKAIFEGVKAAYIKRGRPFMELSLPADRLAAIGAFMQFKMIETMLLAKLLEVNAFDQPAVEEYKSETRRLLA